MPAPLRIRQTGLTLFELALALALVAVMTGIASPSLGRWRAQAAVQRHAYALLGALHEARSIAITRGEPVVLCQSAGTTACLAGSAPAGGWTVFVDRAGGSSARLDAGDELLRSVELPPELRLLGSRRALTYWPVARAGTTATLMLCHAHGEALAVIVSQTGRPRLSRTDATGAALDCGA
ncbi:MAG: GspH/FimT family pseudopilin [Gammaproteobacteria bacterium]|nr:GspH/FimT family pseudopilin [Gammaproteobacteria bacterium]